MDNNKINQNMVDNLSSLATTASSICARATSDPEQAAHLVAGNSPNSPSLCNLPHTQTSNSPKHGNCSSIEMGNSLHPDKNDSSKQDPACLTKNYLSKQDPTNLTKNYTSNQDPAHLTKSDSSKQNPAHLTKIYSSKHDPAHLIKNDSSKQGDHVHLDKNDSPKQADLSHPTKNDSSKQDPAHLTKNDSSKQNPAHLTKNDSSKQDLAHLTKNDSSKQDLTHLTKNDSSKQGNPVHLDKNDSPKQDDPSYLTRNDSPKQGDPSHLTKNDSKNDPAPLTKKDSSKQDPVHLTKNDLSKQDLAHLTKNDSSKQVLAHLTKNDSSKQDLAHLTKNDSSKLGDSSKQDPAHITKNYSSKQDPAHLTKIYSSKYDPAHLTKNDSSKQGDCVHLDKNDSPKQADLSHITKNDSSKQDPAHLTKNDSSKQNPAHLTKNDSSKQDLAHLTKNDSSKQDLAHLTKNDSSKQGNPVHLDKNDSPKQDDPSYLTRNDSPKQGDPSHLTNNDSKNDPAHLTKKDSSKQDPAHLTKNDSTKNDPAHLTENDYSKCDPAYLTKNDSSKHDPAHLTKNDSPNQGIPAHLGHHDSPNQGIPAHLVDHGPAKSGDPSYITKNDSPNKDNPIFLRKCDSPNQVEHAHTGEKDSPNQDKSPYQQAMDSLNLITLFPDSSSASEFGKTMRSDVNDATAAIETLSNTSTESNVPVLEEIKLDEISKTKNVTLQDENRDAEASKKELLSDEKFAIVNTDKPTAPKTAGRNTFSKLKKETKSFTLTVRHTRGLECLGFKKHCEDMFPGLTLQFNKEQNVIMLESETDYCKVVKKEASNFLDKCKKCTWKLDSRQTFLLTECPSKITWWIDLCYKNCVYCCFDRQMERIRIYAKAENTLQKCREYFDKQMHCETFYFALDDNQEVESYLKDLQRIEQNFYFSRTTDRRIELICLSQFSKKISEDIIVHVCLSETDITFPETLPSNMTQTQNDSDQNRTDNNEVNMQMKSQGSVDSERQFEFHCTTDVRAKSSQQAIDQGCFGDAVTLFSLSKLEANNESPSSSAETNHPSAQQLPASITDGLVQNKTGSTVLSNDDSAKYNNNVTVKKELESENQYLLNDSHSNEPSMCEEQKTDRLQLTRLEAELISHPEIKKELLLSLNDNNQYVQFYLNEGFLEIKSGDPKTLKDIMASEIHTEQITADKDVQALADSRFSCYLVKKFDPELKQITVVFHRKISEDLLPIINRFKFSRYFYIFPLCTTTYTRSYLAKVAEIIQSQFQFNVDIEVTCDDSHASLQGFNITTEKTKLEEVKSTVDHLMKAIQIKTEVLKPHDANRLLSSQGQQYLMQLEEKHKCQINVVSCDRHVFMRASCPSGHKLFMMEGTMAIADCQILVLPLCDGQKQWPSQYISILEKSFLTTDMGQYSGIRAPPSPCTLSLECNGEAKGQTVVVMFIPSRKDRNFNDSIAKVYEIMLSEISGKSTIAMPLELSTDISYRESLPVILRVIREHTLKNETKPFSVFFYVGDQTLQTLQAITQFVETLLGKEEKFPLWKTNILPLGPYHRVKIMEADLEKVKADVIVKSTDLGLLHTSGAVSSALLKAAGPEMTDQCKKLYPDGIGNRILVTTDSFRLGGVKAIFNIVLPQTWSHKTGTEELRSRIKTCLTEASINKYESIAFPALGVGRLGYPPDIVAYTMFTAATDFFLIMPESTLENVYFVCHPFDKKAVRAFKVEDDRQKRKLQRPEDEQNECKDKREQTAGLNKEALIHICGPKYEIEQAMFKLKMMQISIPGIQRSFVSKDRSAHPEDVPLPKETEDATTLKVLDNTRQLPHPSLLHIIDDNTYLMSENKHEDDEELFSAESSLTKDNKHLPSSGSAATLNNKELPSSRSSVAQADTEPPSPRSSVAQDNKEMHLPRSSVAQDNKELPSVRSSVAQVNTEPPSPKSCVARYNKELPSSKRSVKQGNKEPFSYRRSVTQVNKEMPSSISSVTEDNEKLPSSGSSFTQDNKEPPSFRRSVTKDNKELPSSRSSVTQDNKELHSSGSSVTPQDNKEPHSSRSVTQDNKELPSSRSSITQDNKEPPSSRLYVTMDDKVLPLVRSSVRQVNIELPSSGSSVTPQDNKELSTSGSSVTPKDNKEMSSSGSSVNPQDNKEPHSSRSVTQDNKELPSSRSSITQDNKEPPSSRLYVTMDDKVLPLVRSSVRQVNIELPSSGSSVTPQDNKELSTSGSSVTPKDNKEMSSSGSSVNPQDNKEPHSSRSVTQDNKELPSSRSSITQDNKEPPSSRLYVTMDDKVLPLVRSSVRQVNIELPSSGSSVTPQDNKELSSSGSSVNPQDNKELSTSGSSVTPKDNKEMSSSGSSVNPQDNKELSTSGSSVTPKDNKEMSSSGSSVNPQDNKELSTSGSSVTPKDNKELSSSGSSVTPQDNKEPHSSRSVTQDNKELPPSRSSITQDNKEPPSSRLYVTMDDKVLPLVRSSVRQVNIELPSSGSSVTPQDNKELSTSGSSVTPKDNKELSSSGSSVTPQDNKEPHSSRSVTQDNKELPSSRSSITQDNKEPPSSRLYVTMDDKVLPLVRSSVRQVNIELPSSGSSVTPQDNKELNTSPSSVTPQDNKELSSSGCSVTPQDNKEMSSSGSSVAQDNKELNSSGNSVTQGNNSLSSSGSHVTKDNKGLSSFGSFVTGDENINSLKVIACMKGKCLSVYTPNKFEHMCANYTATRNNPDEKEFLEIGNEKIPQKDYVSLASHSPCPNQTSLKFDGFSNNVSSCSNHSQFSEASEEKKSKVDQSLTRHSAIVDEKTCTSTEDSSKDQTYTSHVQYTLKSTTPCNQEQNSGNGNHPTSDKEFGFLKEGNHIVLEQSIADLLTVEDIEKEVFYVMMMNKQYIELDLPKCKIIVLIGDIKEVERLLASIIAVVKVPVGETENVKKIVSIIAKNLDQKLSSNARIRFDNIKHELVIALRKSIESDVHTLLGEIMYKRMCLPLPTYILNYILLFKQHIFKNIHSYQRFQVELLQFMNKNDTDHPALKITSERLHFSDILKIVDKILANILLKELQIKPSLARYLQSIQGQNILTLLRHHCHVEVSSPEQQVIMSAVSSQEKKVILCEGSIAATDCRVVILPLQTGQRNLPPVHKLILKRGLISTDLNDIATHVEDLEIPWTLALESNGHAKGQTVVLMQVPELNEAFSHQLVTVCQKALKSVVSMSKTVAMPVRLSEIIPLEKSLEHILQAIRELPEQGDIPKTVFLYLDRLSESELKKLTDVLIKTLTAGSQNCWKTTFWQAKKSCRLQNRVQVIVEDFTAVHADVLVNSTDTKLEHKEDIVSRILLKKAGQGLENQCKSLYPNGIEDNTVLVTDSFELQFAKQVYHIAFKGMWNSELRNILLEELRWRVQACLMLASSKGYTSIAFPALGTGKLKYPPIEVSQTMFAAASDFFTEMPQSSLKKVFIVCYHQNLAAIKNFKLVETVYNFSLHQKTDKQCEEKVSEGYLEMGTTSVQIVPENCNFKSCDDDPLTKEFKCNNKDQLIQVLKVQGKNLLWMQINLCSFDPKDYDAVVSVLAETVEAKPTNLQNVILKVPDDLVSILISHFEKPYKTYSYLRNKEIKRQVHINHHVPTSLQMVQELSSIQISGTSQNIHHIVAEIEKMQPPVSFEKSMADDGTCSSVDFENGNGKQKETKDEKALKVLDNTQQLPHDGICSLKPNRHLSSTLTGVHLSSSQADEHLCTNQTGSTTEVQIKHGSGNIAKAGNHGTFQQISKNITEHKNTSGNSYTGSFIREIDCLTYDALRYIFGDHFTNAFSTLHKDTEKVTVQIPSTEAWQSVEEKMALVRQEDLSLSFQEIEVLGNSVDMKAENVDAFVKLLHDQSKAIIFGCDYNAVTKAKHLILIKCGRLKLTSRAKRQFAAGPGDRGCIQTSTQITGASPDIGFVKDFVTKSGIIVSMDKKDITQLAVNAITNAANKNLDHIGGVAAAIAGAAGSDLEVEGKEYVRKFGPLKVTDIVKTTAGRLPCQAVLHAVGPSWDDYQNKEECKQALQQTVYNCLRKSHDLNYTSLAVTSISSGIFGVPKAICADSYLAALQSFEDQHGSNTRLQHIHFVDTSDEMIGIIRDTFEKNWHIPILPNYVQQSF